MPRFRVQESVFQFQMPENKGRRGYIYGYIVQNPMNQASQEKAP